MRLFFSLLLFSLTFGFVSSPLLWANDEDFQKAVKHFKEFEIRPALEILHRLASDSSLSKDRQAEVALYKALCHAYLREASDADKAFRRALSLNPSITPPPGTPSRIQKMFEDARSSGGSSPPPVEERRTEPPPVEERRTEPPPVEERRTEPPPKRRMTAAIPEGDLTPPETPKPASSGSNTVMLILGGIAIAAAAGLLTGGIITGVMAGTAISEGKKPSTSQIDAQRFQRDAQSQSLTANILYGAAGAAAIGAIVFFILSPNRSKPSPPTSSLPPSLPSERAALLWRSP